MSIQIESADRQAVVSAFGKGDNGFRFIRILAADKSGVRFAVDNRIFNGVCGEKPVVGMLYRARLSNIAGKIQIRLIGEPLTAVPASETVSGTGSAALLPRATEKAKMRLSAEVRKAAAEFAGNRLEAPASQTEAFYADLFACRFDKPDFAEELELFNACGTPPRFRSVIPFEWNGIRGYLDLMVAGNRLVSYRFRILSAHIDALIHADPVSGEMTVDTFGAVPLLPEGLANLDSLSQYRLRAGRNIRSAVAYADENPYREIDEWM